MIRRIEGVFEFPQYANLVERNRARYIAILQIAAVIVTFAYVLFVPEWVLPSAAPDAPRVIALVAFAERPDLLIVYGGVVVLALATLALVHVKRLMAAGIALVLSVLLVTGILVLVTPDQSFDNVTFVTAFPLAAFLGFLLINQWGGIFTIIFCTMLLIADPGTLSVEEILGSVLVLTGTGVIGFFYLRLFDVAQLEEQRAVSGERTRFAEIISELTRLSSETRSLNQTLTDSLKLIQTNYSQFESAAVYLIDDKGLYAELAESVGVMRTSEQGRFTVGDVSPVGQAALSGTIQTRIIDGNLVEGAALLPGMQSQIAVPMHFGQRVLGVLDLQSSQRSPSSDLADLITLADALALVVNSVQQIEAARERLSENVRLAEQARNALTEVQRLNRRLIGRAWNEYLKEKREFASVEYDPASGTLTSADVSSPHIDAVVQSGRPHAADGVLAIPLRARGQVLGAIELELPPDAVIDPAQMELVNELADRFGLAIENTRLLEQSQSSAQRESLINVISARIQTTTNVEAMLAETARSLSELMQLDHVSIRLGTPDQLPPKRAMEEMA